MAIPKDNALVETIIDLYKTEVIHQHGSRRNLKAVEFATLELVDWFNKRRSLGLIVHRPSGEVETEFHQNESAIAG